MAVVKPQEENTTKTFRDNAVANPNAAADLGDVDPLRISIERLEIRVKKLEARVSRYGGE